MLQRFDWKSSVDRCGLEKRAWAIWAILNWCRFSCWFVMMMMMMMVMMMGGGGGGRRGGGGELWWIFCKILYQKEISWTSKQLKATIQKVSPYVVNMWSSRCWRISTLFQVQ